MMLVFVFVYKINLILCDRCDDECGSSVFSVLFKEEDKQKIQSKIDERTRVICRARREEDRELGLQCFKKHSSTYVRKKVRRALLFGLTNIARRSCKSRQRLKRTAKCGAKKEKKSTKIKLTCDRTKHKHNTHLFNINVQHTI
jgi:hypothetical protein